MIAPKNMTGKDGAPHAPGAYTQRSLTHIGYTALDNGDGVCLLVPYVPGMGETWIEGTDAHIQIAGGEIVLLEIGDAALRAAAAAKLIVVGVDALSRPVFEGLVKSAEEHAPS